MNKHLKRCLAALLSLTLTMSCVAPVSGEVWSGEETVRLPEAVQQAVETVMVTNPQTYAQAVCDHDFTDGACSVCGAVAELSLVASARQLEQGELFTVDAFLENTRYVDVVSVALTYDETAFQLVGGTCHVSGASFSAVLPEQKAGTLMLSPRAAVSGKIFSFRFYVKNSAQAQDFDISGVCGVVRGNEQNTIEAVGTQVQVGLCHRWGSWSGSSTYKRSCTICGTTQSGTADSYGVVYNSGKTQLLGTVKAVSGGYTVPDTVVYIEKNAFKDRTGLTAITFPAGLTGIGTDAFAGCTNMTTVFYKGTEAQMHRISMGNDPRELEGAVWHCQPQSAQFGGKSCWYCAECDEYFLSNGKYATATVTFQYADGTVIRSTSARYGEMVNAPVNPPAPAGEEGLVLSGWDKTPVPCTGNAVYTAEFSPKGGTGDLNNDEKVDADDVVALLLHISMPDQFSIQGNGDMDGNSAVDTQDAVMLLLHVSLPEMFPLGAAEASVFYYNPTRKYNSTTGETTRSPDSSGYYVFDLLVDGEEKTFKTADKTIASAIDEFSYIPFGLEVSGDIIQKVLDSEEIPGVKELAVSNYDVMELGDGTVTVTRMRPDYNNVGDSVTLKLSEDLKVWDLSSYAENRGARCQLALGDRGIYYTNRSGEVEWAFIWYKNTHEEGHISYCEHCRKPVYWQPYTADTYSEEGVNGIHLYLTHDRKLAEETHGWSGMKDSEKKEVVIDLNGKTLQATSGSNFTVFAELSIVDTVGGGKLVGSTSSDGRAVTVQAGGVVNLYSGILTQCADSNTQRNGGVVYVDEDATLYMYGGSILDGAAANGGNVFVMGTFHMSGGTVGGGKAVAESAGTSVSDGRGGNITVEDGGYLDMTGGEICDGIAASFLQVSGSTTTPKGGNGGNVYVDSSSSAKIGTATGGTVCILGGTARVGGNIYATGIVEVEKSGFVVAGSAVAAYDGDTDFNAGNIYASKKLTVKGEVSDGIAYAGGNIFTPGGVTVTVDGGKVERGVSSAAGGNISTNNGVIYLKNGALLADGETGGRGGNVNLNVGGELRITDSTVRGGVAEASGGNIYAAGREVSGGYDYAVITAQDSTISDGTAQAVSAYSGGGNIYAVYAQVTLAGTRVEGGAADQCGGNMLISRADMTLDAGTVVDGGELTAAQAASNGEMLGSNICKFNEGKLEILADAVVSGGGDTGLGTVFISDASSAKTGELYVAGTVYGLLYVANTVKKITLAGKTRIDEMTLVSGVKLTLSNMVSGAYVQVNASGVFTDTISGSRAAEYVRYFHDAKDVQSIYVDGNALAISNKQRCPHCSKMVEWETFDPSKTYYTGDAHLIVNANVSLPKQFQVGSTTAPGHCLTLDLNGKTVSATNRLALVYGELTILDTSAAKTGKVVTTTTSTNNGGLILAPADSVLNIYGGTFTVGSGVTTGRQGGLISSQSDVNIYGGTFTGGNLVATNANACGGNIYISSTGSLKMYNATVSGGKATVKTSGYSFLGGNICSEGGAVHIENCTISGGAATTGGNIYCTGAFTMLDTNVSGGTSTGDGGNLYIDNTADITGGTISGGVASGNGGNIMFDKINKSAMYIGEGTTISNGQAKIGGNVYSLYYTSVRGTITGGTATSYAGNIYHIGSLVIGVEEGTVAAKITNGSAPYAGNIYSAWTLTINPGTTVSGGKTTKSNPGGNIYIVHSQTTTILGTVSGGTATTRGGNIYVSGEGILNIGKEDGSVRATVSGGTATTCGGNIYMNKGTLNVYKGATVTGGSARSDKNIGKSSSATVNIYGTVG